MSLDIHDGYTLPRDTSPSHDARLWHNALRPWAGVQGRGGIGEVTGAKAKAKVSCQSNGRSAKDNLDTGNGRILGKMPPGKAEGKTQRTSSSYRTVTGTFGRCPSPPLREKERSVKGIGGE